jgi:hypothetical protein
VENFPSATGGNIGFADPWLPDSVYPGYYNIYANRNTDAVLKQRSSPFNPDYATPYSGDVYKGIFLDQNPTFDPNVPGYLASAPPVQLINDYTAFFSGWEVSPSGSATIQYPDSLTTAVVFND